MFSIMRALSIERRPCEPERDWLRCTAATAGGAHDEHCRMRGVHGRPERYGGPETGNHSDRTQLRLIKNWHASGIRASRTRPDEESFPQGNGDDRQPGITARAWSRASGLISPFAVLTSDRALVPPYKPGGESR